jgi:hypothetical protein
VPLDAAKLGVDKIKFSAARQLDAACDQAIAVQTL